MVNPYRQDQHRGNDPSYEAFLRSRLDLWRGVELDVALRLIDDLPEPGVPEYVELDARLGWHVSDAVEVWVAGANLLHEQHQESIPDANIREIPRSVSVGLRWRM